MALAVSARFGLAKFPPVPRQYAGFPTCGGDDTVTARRLYLAQNARLAIGALACSQPDQADIGELGRALIGSCCCGDYPICT